MTAHNKAHPLADAPGRPHLPEHPLISVIVHSFRQRDSIGACLEAVLAQRLPPNVQVEVVLADDGSDDGTVELLEHQVRQRPWLFRPSFNPHRTQLPAPCTPGRWTLLRAMYEARGTYVAFIDGDDHWTDPQKLALQLERMEQRPEAGLCVHDGFDVYADGRTIPYVRARAQRNELPERFTTVDTVLTNYFPKGSMFFRKDRLPEDRTALERAPAMDWTLTLLLSLPAPVEYIDRPMCVRRVSDTGIIAAKAPLVKVEWNIRHLELNDRLTSGAHHGTIQRQLIVLHLRALELAHRMNDRERWSAHLRWCVRHGALGFRAAWRERLALHAPRLLACYSALRGAGRS